MDGQVGQVKDRASIKVHNKMPVKMGLKELFEKYRNHPEFLGISIQDLNQRGALDDSLLHIAARKGDIEDVEVMISHGADVNLVGDLGNTPLHQAAMAGKAEVVSELLKQGANPALKNEFYQTALDMAMLGNHDEVVRILKE